MIKTVVLDLGGVIFAEGKNAALQRLHDELGYDPELIDSIISSPESQDLRRGLVGHDDFWNWAHSQLPHDYSTQKIQQYWYESYVLNEEMLSVVKKLKSDYRLVIFSDNEIKRLDYLERKYNFRALVEAEVYSFDMHLIKTNVGLTKPMLSVCAAEPSEIIYIDDQESVVGESREAGVNVIIYNNNRITGLYTELERLGIKL